ncbi:hypothetical protein C1H46_008734 [Malus baccata]|uniref:Uncharacterized protein n=1 Tax=Malus baccata TaxID=106549 RepID=A0A540N3I4_MALBA|nr:hypothetical protein C1H46_008734 [Malus baccata]
MAILAGVGLSQVLGHICEPVLEEKKNLLSQQDEKASPNIGLRVSTKNTPARAGCSHWGRKPAPPLYVAVFLEEISRCKVMGSTVSKFLGMEKVPRHWGKRKPKKFKLKFLQELQLY